MKLQWFSVTIPLAFHTGVLQLHTEVSGPAPEDAFGSFRVLHQVGAGVLGPVFRAYDPERDRLVAVKLFRLDLPPERVHRLVAEFEKLIEAGLSHPAIAAPIETGIVGASAYLAQDYVSADSLDIVVRDHGPAPAADALRVAAQVAAALDFAEVFGFAHGALHPRDIMLAPDEARLTGIGIARALEAVGASVPMRRPYGAPERVAGSSWDRRADVFSLAAVMHELLWGRRITATGEQAADALTDLAGCHLEQLRAVFACALAEDPAARYETALEFAQELKHAFPAVIIANQQAPQPVLPLEDPVVQPRTAPDLDLRALDAATDEAERLPDLASEPPTVEPEEPAPAHEPSRLATFAYEQSRSAVWPLVLAVVVGVALGFAGGYGVGVHDRPAATLAPAVVPVTTPGGLEFTESSVAEPARSPAEPARVPAAPPAQRSKIPPPDRDGILLVRTTPVGAQVFVDGRDQGRTPLTVRDLALGPHRVRVVRDGYDTEERRVVISASRVPLSVALTLLPQPAPASRAPRPASAPPVTTAPSFGVLSVESRPAGANVFVDNRLVGKTPLALPDVAAGEHAVRLELDGYRRWVSSARVTAGERFRLTASLEK